jgi:hypothetical protein
MKSWRAYAGVWALVALMTAIGGLAVVSLSARAATPEPVSLPSSPCPPHLGYGINVRFEESIDPLFAPLDLEWIKLWEEYEGAPPAERLPYQVLYVIDLREGMPTDLDQWGDEVEGIARAGLGYVEAYEIGNEPNVDRFWGYEPPDPAEYAQVLGAAYEHIKAVDPGAIVVSAGLAPVGRIEGACIGGSGHIWQSNNCSAMDEREYTLRMLESGATDHFDAFGYHPYGFAYDPETDPYSVSNGFAFRGAEVMHDLLEEQGLGYRPVWATEFNWLRDWTEDGGMPEAARYFSMRRGDGTVDGAATLAYDAIQAMEKRPGHFGPRLALRPAALSFLADAYEPGVITATITPWNSGYRVLTWTVAVAAGMEVTPSLVITNGFQGAPLTVTVDSTGYEPGVFAGVITVTAASTDVLDSPQTVPLTLTVERFEPRLAVSPPALGFLGDVREAGVLTGTVTPINTGYHVLTWTASVIAGMQVSGTGTLGTEVTPTLAITMGLQGTPLTITVDSTGYSTGTYVGLVSVTAVQTNVLDSPQIVPVILRIVPELYRVYLPLTLRHIP